MALEAVDWAVPAGVLAFTSTRAGGASPPPFDGFNLGCRVGDAEEAVAANRAALAGELPAGARVRWLRQVHGTAVLDDDGDEQAPADAAVTRRAGVACAVLTADCLPVLFCADDGSAVGVAHAGWRGLAAGVLEGAVAALDHPPARILAWLGPAIGPSAFEVGPEVREAFRASWPAREDALEAGFAPGRGDRLQADLHGLARARLQALGLSRIASDPRCTASDPARFFSHRRDGRTGRMASLILITPSAGSGQARRR